MRKTVEKRAASEVNTWWATAKSFCKSSDEKELRWYLEMAVRRGFHLGQAYESRRLKKKGVALALAPPKGALGHGSGPLPGGDVTVVQTGRKTVFVREEK